ncbi:MAG: hypothetical protein MPN21_10550 [Thermoanaerobaculia bacterium]|nr:hypothetical protein [Thermoanaerobaculia bacterium]
MNCAALSVLAESGLHGYEAAAALRRVLAELASPSASSQSVLADMGLDPSDVDSSLRRNVGIFRRLADAGLDRERAEALFGTVAHVALALIDRIERLEELES